MSDTLSQVSSSDSIDLLSSDHESSGGRELDNRAERISEAAAALVIVMDKSRGRVIVVDGSSYRSVGVVVVTMVLEVSDVDVKAGSGETVGRSFLLEVEDAGLVSSDLPDKWLKSIFGGSGSSVTAKTWKSLDGRTLLHRLPELKEAISKVVSGIKVIPTCIWLFWFWTCRAAS